MPDSLLLAPSKLAKVLGWTQTRTKRWMLREGLGLKVGHRWYTTPTKIRMAFPELYVEVALALGRTNDEES